MADTRMTLATAAERVVGVPELLDTIFSHNTRADNARCARTSRALANLALNHVWRVSPPLKALFRLLAPLVRKSEIRRPEKHLLVFERAVVPNDWKRFGPYAERVRELHITPYEDENNDSRTFIDESMFTEVSLTRPTLCILPRLERLYIYETLPSSWYRHSVLFLHKSISFLSLDVSEYYHAAKGARPLLSEILCRSPAITQFELSAGWSAEEFEHEVCLLLSGLKYLETLCLSPCRLTAPVLHSIALLPSLSRVSMLPHSCGCPFAGNVTYFKPPDFDNAFTSLSDLEIQGRFVTIAEFFLFKRFPLNLRILSVGITQHDPSPDFRMWLEAIAGSCPRLESLKLDLVGDPNVGIMSWDADPITAHKLSPLKSFPSLETFNLNFYEPLDMTDMELVSIVRACPSLQSLHLNSCPLSLAPTSLTLQFLALLSKEPMAQNLEYLGVYLDASETSNITEIGRCMKNMRSVSFGSSPVREINDSLLIYLSRLLPVACEMCLDEPERSLEFSDDEVGELDQRLSVWREVRKVLPLLTLIRQDEQKLKREEA